MDAILALDAQQRILLFNPAAEAMFRCPAAEALGQPLDRFLPPGLRERHVEHVAAFSRSGETSRSMSLLHPLTAVRADGEEFPIEATIARVEIDGHLYSAAIIRDISIRQVRERSLRQQGELLDLAYDAIFAWDRSGRITFWNRGAESLYGYAREEAVGRISHTLLRTRHPEGYAAVLSSLERDGTWEGELIHRRRDGREVTVASRLALVDGEANRYVLVLEVAEDISARKVAEADRATSQRREAAARAEAEAAATARNQLQAILNALPGGVMLLTAPDGSIGFANTAMRELVFAHRESDSRALVYGQHFGFSHFDGTPIPIDAQPVTRALQGEHIDHLQLLLWRGDHSTLPVEVFAAPLGMRGGIPARAVVYVHDISRLLQAEQFKDDFLALVSHELRTPLTAIQGGARLLVNKPELDAATRSELLHDVVAESQRLDRLLGNLLSLTQILAGRLHVATEPVPVASLARRIVAAFAARNSSYSFAVDSGSELMVAEADPNLLEEILRNLYENAIKYSPHGGTILTTIATEGKRVVTRVTDEGIGIAPEHVATVFERFRRVSGDQTVRGMGLGLYLSQALAVAQGGRVEATSPGIGRGATFSVILPVAHEEPPSPRAAPGAP